MSVVYEPREERIYGKLDMDGNKFYSSLDKHGLPIYICSTCQITYIQKYSINTHIESHLEEKTVLL